MREIILDTETTGISPDDGDRIVEIGCLEVEHQMPTGRTFQCYLNPERPMSQGATNITGISDAFLRDKPKFAEKVDDFLAFIGDSKLVMHNAPFDMGFLNHELALIGRPALGYDRVVDTLEIARTKFAGAKNDLNSLCRRFGVDNSGREKHGALLDSELLAEVYLELKGGRQPGLIFKQDRLDCNDQEIKQHTDTARPRRPEPLPSRLTQAEESAHQEFIKNLSAPSKWQATE
ncbi:ATP-dependent DNA helicase PcrA protein [Candidatus Micropelagos thuwalensis]|uniref:DNA polymerase III subunit epsilon n=1 Tax=Candidatus Micropelagius thuwalensis TaxID=1397666 RepID=U2WSU4_9PROT|nr:DNA polymerase III subunit epsilon [Candidatus Micropelagos thuwalensis]ERL46640.1 ATP-dependent DNA helicase PcrA protein [Candidatus Micropelagos thuwalensis]